MAEYETEEQQVEAIKNWWKENGFAVVGGAVLGISALVGWRAWGWHQDKQATEASDLYAIVQQAANKNDAVLLEGSANKLQADYASTPYASLAGLHLAKVKNDKGDTTGSEDSLRWVLKNSKQNSVQDIARIRLARILLAENKIDEAQSLINSNFSEAYSSLVNEVRGDIYVAKGEIEQAKQAYDQAMQTSSGSSVEYLELKRSDLGS